MKALTVTNLDVELSVTVYGDANKPSLLFLHGFPDCQKTWDHQVNALKNNYQVVTFDMRGVGESTWSGKRNAYLIENLLSDIEAVINAVVGPTGKVHLVGHDWGSVIGWSFISDPFYSKRILSYSSMSGPHLALMLDWLKNNILSGEPGRVLNVLKQVSFSWYIYLFNLPFLPEFLFTRFGKPIWRTALMYNGVDKDDRYLNTDQETIEKIVINAVNLYRQNPLNPPPKPAPMSIKVPVQLLIPRDDMFISHNLFEDYDSYVVQLTRHHIAGKHWTHHSHAQEFNEKISAFINQIEISISNKAA
ncbi:MAG: alpha/beta fold hydrolase [Pseudomonadales bacterium]|nr:alpha/beta fold hydrolase [Pseudomonadales bacterium]